VNANTSATSPGRTNEPSNESTERCSDSSHSGVSGSSSPVIRKGQLLLQGCIALSFTDQFYALAQQIRPV
jgi:hypothetical protein